jgi:EmrB/QacA subfamily drug resistance transporter
VAPKESSARWWTVAAMTAGLTVVFFDLTAVSVALPSIRRDLGGSHAELAWVMNAFLLALAAVAAVGGRLGDLAGRRPVLVGSLCLFSLASLACGLAPSEGWLIAARAAQGIAAAAVIPTTTAVVSDAFGEAERGRALGIYIGVASLFLSIGPLVGGALSELASWRWVFFLNVPVAAVTVAGTLRYVRADRRRLEPGGLDLIGGAMLVLGLGAVVLALMQGRAWGWTSVPTLGLLAVGVLLLAAFPRVESRWSQPILPLRLLRERAYLGAAVVVLCGRFVAVGALVLSAIYLQDELGFGPLHAGLAMLPATIPTVLIAPVAGVATDRFGARLCAAAGAVLLAGSLLVLGLLAPGGSYGELWPGLVGFGVGIGLVTVATTTAGMGVAAPLERGEAAGLLATARHVGGALGLAVMSAAFSAVTVAERSGEPAIGDGLEAALLVAAGVSVVAAVTAVALLRGDRAPGPTAAPAPNVPEHPV